MHTLTTNLPYGSYTGDTISTNPFDAFLGINNPFDDPLILPAPTQVSVYQTPVNTRQQNFGGHIWHLIGVLQARRDVQNAYTPHRKEEGHEKL